MRPVPVVLRRIALVLQLSAMQHETHVGASLWVFEGVGSHSAVHKPCCRSVLACLRQDLRLALIAPSLLRRLR